MWMVVRVRDTEILHEVLDRWKAGIDAGAPQRVAEVFTENAIFQGLHPYSVGRRGVVEYYSAQPPGMTVTYRVLETRRPADDLVLGYAKADFAFPDRPTVDVYLGVLLERGDDGWRIGHYQVSRLGG
jgi:uncharacterized protein (TIGR02246 family)